MNCLKQDPNHIKIDIQRREYDYNCFNILIDYNIPIHIYIQGLLGIEEFKLKNIWNHIIIRWNQMKLEMKDNKEYIESQYSKEDYYQIHSFMNDEKLNENLNQFIHENIFKCLFVINCIQNYISPK